MSRNQKERGKTMCMRSGRVTIATVALSTVSADQSNTLAVDIPAQPLAAALVELSEETGLRVVASDGCSKAPQASQEAIGNVRSDQMCP